MHPETHVTSTTSKTPPLGCRKRVQTLIRLLRHVKPCPSRTVWGSDGSNSRQSEKRARVHHNEATDKRSPARRLRPHSRRGAALVGDPIPGETAAVRFEIDLPDEKLPRGRFGTT